MFPGGSVCQVPDINATTCGAEIFYLLRVILALAASCYFTINATTWLGISKL